MTDLSALTPLLGKLNGLSVSELRSIHKLVAGAEKQSKREVCQNSFLEFVKEMWPGFVQGHHHSLVASEFQKIESGKNSRLIVNMPPRHTKSEFASYLFPAWFLGKNPGKKVIQASHTGEFATNFGRKVRNLLDSKEYQEIFPGVSLQKDSKAAGRWNTNHGGEYFAVGVGGAVAGKGADLLIIDDPVSEQAEQSIEGSTYDMINEWFSSGPRQRLQPGGSIVVVMTRWHKRDLTGHLIKASIQREGTQEWKLIELPAILKSGRSLWPEFWPQKEMEALRAELPVGKWQAQYQQNPTSEEGAIVKREWWKVWEETDPPDCSYTIQTWDTAYLKNQRNDYSAYTRWGVFDHPDDNGKLQANIILLDAWKERIEFPELKKKALRFYKQDAPDTLIVEAKASGLPLIQELRSMGILVQDYTPTRGGKFSPNDKVSRINGVSDLFSSGKVWRPDTRFGEMVMEEFGEFPTGEHDDLVDSSYLALRRFREGGFIRLPNDEAEDESWVNPPLQTQHPYY